MREMLDERAKLRSSKGDKGYYDLSEPKGSVHSFTGFV